MPGVFAVARAVRRGRGPGAQRQRGVTAMARGRVKRWFADRGTGFLTDLADGTDVFFGDRSLRGLTPADVTVGMEVEFDRREGNRGPAAANVRRAGAPAPP